MNPKIKGYILAIIAAATYGMNPLFALPLYEDGLNTDSVLFFRYLIAIPIIAFSILVRKRSFRITKKEIIPLTIMGLLISVSSLTLFLSYNYIDVGIASTLLFVYPIMVTLIMCIVYKEKLTLTTIICLCIVTFAIFLLCKTSSGAILNLTGVALVMLSALLYAIYIVGVNRPILKNVATLKITFYCLIVGLILFFIRLDFGQNITVPSPDKWYLWFNLLALAIFPTVISFICTTRAIQYIGSTVTAILGALEPVTGLFFGVVVFGEVLTMRTSVGVLLIIISVTIIVASGNIAPYLVRFRRLFPKINPKMLKRKKSQNKL